MSGPIVRKYGFPNFEQIFGSQTPQHGVEDGEGSQTDKPAAPAKKAEARPKSKGDAKAESKPKSRKS